MAAKVAPPHQCLTIALQASPIGWRVGLRKRKLGVARTKGRVVLRPLSNDPLIGRGGLACAMPMGLLLCRSPLVDRMVHRACEAPGASTPPLRFFFLTCFDCSRKLASCD